MISKSVSRIIKNQNWFARVFTVTMALSFWLLNIAHATETADRVVIVNDGWELVGDWQNAAEATKARGVVLLLHKAAGDRSAYIRMAQVLSARGFSSLRIDLRGHGESINLKAFDPTISRFENPDDEAVVANFELIRQGYLDISAIVSWLKENKSVSDMPFAIIGSSYTGEEMTKAIEMTGFADAYVALAPGNFSQASITKIDPSQKPWLFIRAEQEMSFFDAIFEAIEKGSGAEIWILPGAGHATDLFNHNDKLEERIVDWLESQLFK